MHQKKQCNEVYRNNRFYPFTKVDHDSCTHYRHHNTDDIPAIFPVDFSNLITNLDFLNFPNWKFPLSCTYDFSSKRLHHFKNNAIWVSKIKSSTFPKSIRSKVEILRFRQAFYMIFYQGSVNRINVIRVKAHF